MWGMCAGQQLDALSSQWSSYLYIIAESIKAAITKKKNMNICTLTKVGCNQNKDQDGESGLTSFLL